MSLDQDACYEALKAKDARFDGRFFVGVSSTGIYCRPVCTAKLPKRENCTFFATAAEAEAAGFRPCLQCRPEIAPGMAPVDSERTLAKRTARYLKEHCSEPLNLEDVAAKHGYTSRHVRRAFEEGFGVTPLQYLRTCRLLLAKQLLASTDIPIAQISGIAGFGSVRSFNDAFKKHYGIRPSGMRRRPKSGGNEGTIQLELGYRPPFAWERLLAFLEMRAIPGVEAVQEGAYWRTVRLPAPSGTAELRGWISVRPDEEHDRALVTLSSSLFEVIPQVIERIRHQFDLDADPLAIAEGLAAFEERFPNKLLVGTRLPGCFDAFEMCTRAVLGQQISVKGASTLAGRVAKAYGQPIETPLPALTHGFPSAADIAALGDGAQDALGSLGIVGARTRTIAALARALETGELDLSYGADPAETVPALEAMPGIGPWTAQYIAMRATGFPDAFPSTDLGIKKALDPLTPKEIEAVAEAWRPWRSYATMSLWSAH